MSGISGQALGLGLNQEGLSRLEKIEETGGVVSSYWVTRMTDEIRRLREENKEFRASYERVEKYAQDLLQEREILAAMVPSK